MEDRVRASATERVDHRLTHIPGVRVMSVSHSWHRWCLFHEAYALTIVRGGVGHWRYRRRRGEIVPGSMMLIEPGEMHRTTDVHAAAAFDTLFVDPSTFSATVMRCGLRAEQSHFRTIDSAQPELVRAFGWLHDVLDDPHGGALQQTEAFEVAVRALLEAACEGEPRDHDAAPSRIHRARELLHELCARGAESTDHPITHVAETVSLTPAQLIEGCKRHLGAAPSQYLINLRVARARRLIEAGPSDVIRSLTDVALESGFFDLAHLNRFFRRCLRTSPTGYARAMRVDIQWARASRTSW